MQALLSLKNARNQKQVLEPTKAQSGHAVWPSTTYRIARRQVLGLAATFVLWPAPIMADRIRLVGVIMAYAEGDPEGQERLNMFRRSLRSSGSRDGANADRTPTAGVC